MSNKWIGTPVPVDGITNVEKIYINTNLSAEEVMELFDQVSFVEYSSYSRCHIFGNGLSTLCLQKQPNGTCCILNLYASSGDQASMIPFLYAYTPEGFDLIAQQGLSAGWQPNFKGYIEINNVSDLTNENGDVAYGADNDKLSSLFSTTPFVKAKPETVQEAFAEIANAIREKNGEEGTMKSYDMPDKIRALPNGAVVKTYGATVVPNSGYVENIYVNTKLSVDEVNSLLASIEYKAYGMLEAIVTLKKPTSSLMVYDVSVTTEGADSGYVIVGTKDEEVTPIFNSGSAEFAADITGVSFTGWYSEFNGVFTFDDITVDSTVDSTGTIYFGSQNDKLISLFSITPFGQGSGEEVLLEGEYDGSTVDIDVQSIGGSEEWIGTPLVTDTENSQNIYFNTNLSVEEVVSLINVNNIQYTLVDSHNGNHQYMCDLFILNGATPVRSLYVHVEPGVNDDYPEGVHAYVLTLDGSTEGAIFANMISEMTSFMGWSSTIKSGNGAWIVDNDAIKVTMTHPEIDKISSIISSTPFILGGSGNAGEPCIDLKQYIDNKQIPLKINLTNIPSGGGEAGGSGLGTDYGTYIQLTSSDFRACDVTIDVSNAKIVNPDNIPIYYNEIHVNIADRTMTTSEIKLFEGDVNSIPFATSDGKQTATVTNETYVRGGAIINYDNAFDQAAGTMTSNVYYIKFEDSIDKTLPTLQITVKPRDGVDSGWLDTICLRRLVNSEGTKMYTYMKSSKSTDSVTQEQIIEIPFVGEFTFVAR